MPAPASPTHTAAAVAQDGPIQEGSYQVRPLQIQHHQHHLVSPIPPIPSIPSVPPVLPIPPVPPVSAARAPKRVQLPPLAGSIPPRASKRARMTGPHVSNPYDVVFNGIPVPDAAMVSDMSYHFAPNATDPHSTSQPGATVNDSREGAGKFAIPVPDSNALPSLNHTHSIGLPYTTSGPSFSYPPQSFSQLHLSGHLHANPHSYSRSQCPQLHRAIHYHSTAHAVHLLPTLPFPTEPVPTHTTNPYINHTFPADIFQLSAVDNANVSSFAPQSHYSLAVSVPGTTAFSPHELPQPHTEQSTSRTQHVYHSRINHAFYQPQPAVSSFLQAPVPQFDPHIEPQPPIASDTSSTNDDTAYSYVPPSGRPVSDMHTRAPQPEHHNTVHLPSVSYRRPQGAKSPNTTSLKRGREGSLLPYECPGSEQRQPKSTKRVQSVVTSPLRPRVEDDRSGHLVYRFGDGLDLSSQFPKGRYKILKNLGEGTFGKVVECWDRCEERHVAIKVVRSIQKYRQAAKLEIEILLQLNLNDPTGTYHCVKFLSWFEYHYHMCMVFEKHGPSLYDQLRMNRFKPFPLNQVRDYAFQLLASVNFVHSLTLIHTDLKPENILLDLSSPARGPSTIKLIDFGSATYESQHHSPLISTRHYRAPEVILGLGWTYPVDLWSIGCILVELYTGQALFQTHENLEHLAMMSCVLGPIPEWMMRRAEKSKKKYFRVKGGRCALNWPKGASSEASIQSVQRVQSLWNIIRCSDGHNEFFDLVKRLLTFEPGTRCTSAEALQHPFFRDVRLHSDGQLPSDPVRWTGELNHADAPSAQANSVGDANVHSDTIECGPLREKFNQTNIALHQKDIIKKARELNCSKVLRDSNGAVERELGGGTDADVVNHVTAYEGENEGSVDDGEVKANNPKVGTAARYCEGRDYGDGG